jgi:two-component sensor histidine kinase/PAS domain-containing protein
MLDWLLRMFDPAGFPARWHCGEWSPFLGWLHIASDLTIWFAYMGIPAVIFYFVRRRRDVPLLPVFVLFILFITTCGIGHLVEAGMFWWPAYRFSGSVKLITAVVSLGTLAALVPFTRRALALPGTTELLAKLRSQSAEHHRSKEVLQLTQEQLRMATSASGVGLWSWREGEERAAWDDNLRRIFGLAPNEPAGGPEFLVALVHPDDRGDFRVALAATLRDGVALDARFRIVRRADEVAHVVARSTALLSASGVVCGVSGAFFDVTEEERARERMRNSLGEKETLLREIHHRVKNNLQVISSMLSLQAGNVGEQRYRDMFDDCKTRVRTMALVHDRLYTSDDFGSLDCSAYVRELAEMLLHSHSSRRDQVRFEFALEPVVLDIQTAIPIGLIVNELVTNALKHAFRGREGGVVRIAFDDLGETCRLTICDDGVGLPAGLDPQRSTGLGLRMVTSLVRQLDGRSEWSTGDGATFRVVFRRPALGARPPTP